MTPPGLKRAVAHWWRWLVHTRQAEFDHASEGGWTLDSLWEPTLPPGLASRAAPEAGSETIGH